MIRYRCYDSCTKAHPIGSAHPCRNPANASDPEATDSCYSSSCWDDVGFIRELVNHLLSALCINLNRVHVSGISAGAIMAVNGRRDGYVPPNYTQSYQGLKPPCGDCGTVSLDGFYYTPQVRAGRQLTAPPVHADRVLIAC